MIYEEKEGLYRSTYNMYYLCKIFAHSFTSVSDARITDH